MTNEKLSAAELAGMALEGKELVIAVIAQAMPEWPNNSARQSAEKLYEEIESIGYIAVPVPEIEYVFELLERAGHYAPMHLLKDIDRFLQRSVIGRRLLKEQKG